MIPTLLMITGALTVLAGIGLGIMILRSPVKVLLQSVSGQAHVIETPRTKRIRQSDRKKLIYIAVCCVASGLILFGAGWYLGFADRGNGFWLYKLVYTQDDESIACMDNISEDGKYIFEGKEYSYFIIVSGKEYEFCGKKCDGIEGLREELLAGRRENTVILIDSFAAASQYRAAEKLLTELGIKYETEEL